MYCSASQWFRIGLGSNARFRPTLDSRRPLDQHSEVGFQVAWIAGRLVRNRRLRAPRARRRSERARRRGGALRPPLRLLAGTAFGGGRRCMSSHRRRGRRSSARQTHSGGQVCALTAPPPGGAGGQASQRSGSGSSGRAQAGPARVPDDARLRVARTRREARSGPRVVGPGCETRTDGRAGGRCRTMERTCRRTVSLYAPTISSFPFRRCSSARLARATQFRAIGARILGVHPG